MEIVTAHKGKAHVTAEKMAELNRGIVGAESYVMEGGRQLESELVSNNLLKIYDGSGMMQGRHICIPVGQSDELTIENGNQGMKRIDLVVVRYTKDENTKIENAETIVIKGTPSESAPVVPSYIEGDIRSGDMTVDWPLYEVELDGISVVEVRPLFKILMNMSTINKDLSELRAVSGKVIKIENRRTNSVSHNQSYGLTDVACNSKVFDSSDGLFELISGKIQVQQDMIATITSSIEIGSESGVYYAVLVNGSYDETLVQGMSENRLGQYTSNQTATIHLKKGDIVSVGIGKSGTFSVAASNIYAALTCCCIVLKGDSRLLFL